MKLSDLRRVVIARDGRCVISEIDAGHRCADGFGNHHEPDDLPSLTLGHVREHPGGKRRDEPGWCIAQCAASNLAHDESRLASEVRAYLVAMRKVAA